MIGGSKKQRTNCIVSFITKIDDIIVPVVNDDELFLVF
jgi:hypothetical protein